MSINIIERSLSVWPECMSVWIESLGPVEEILDIHVKNEVWAEPIKTWAKWKPVTRRTITVFHESRAHTRYFVYTDGVWYQI